MKAELAIADIAADDVEAVCAIYRDALSPTYISFAELAEGKASAPGHLNADAAAIFRRQLVASLGNPLCGGFLAARDGKPAGFLLASLRQAEAGHTECWLDDCCVSAVSRQHGIAGLLVRRMLEWGAEHGAAYYLLESGIRNEAAHRAFERLGFTGLSTVFWRAGP